MEEKELFEHYEMQSWELTPRVYQSIGVAALLNVLILFAFGQFNLFSTRGCDTPYVGMVCQVLDSAYVASTFLGKDTGSDSFAYKPTEITDNEEVTFIDVSERLEYPAGYFALANPEQMSENLPTNDFGTLPTTIDPNNPVSTSPSNNGDMLGKPQVIPTPNDKVGDQKVPDELFKIEGNKPSPTYKTPVARTPKQGKNPILSNNSPDNLTIGKTTPKPTPSPTPTPSVDEAKTAQEEFKQKFNKKPLQDFADGVLAKIDSPKPEEKVDLKQPFTVVLDGTLTKDGKFDATKTGFVKGEGNEKMVNVAKSAIEAIGDSTIFSYLQALGVDKVNITLVQDDKQISAIIRSSQPTEEKARTVSSGFNGLIALANMNTKDDKEVQALLKAVNVKAEGKSFVINFAMPKDDAHKLIDQKIQEARQKKSQTQNDDNTKQANAQGLF